MQSLQTFPTEVYQTQPRCTGIGNLGIGIGTGISGATGKHYKAVHNNVAFGSFNYMNNDPEVRAMTRIVFNGNNNRGEFHCGADNFQNCMSGEIIDNSGNYPVTYLNANANVRYMRQQLNAGSFPGENQMQQQRCYIQRSQGQQARFVRVQGSKMRPNNMYRNFNNNQQRQKQNRRFVTKGFNNYNAHKSNASTDGFFEEESGSSPKRCMQQQDYQDVSEKDVERKMSTSLKQENHQSKPKSSRSIISGTMNSYHRSSKLCGTSSPLLEPKVEYVVGNSSHDLSYDDISENSDDNGGDLDLRERLTRKKHDQIIKREPGELDSEEEVEEKVTLKRKTMKTFADEDKPKRFKHSDGISSTSSEYKNKETKKSQKHGRKDSGKKYIRGTYLCHDNRRSPSQEPEKNAQAKNQTHKSCCSVPFSTTYSDNTDQNYCCQEAELADLKEKMNSMKQSLRDAQDKLLEANVVGSKKTLRLQDEITQLKKQLEEAAKTENELKTSLKNVEAELSTKIAELAKMTLLNEVEKQDKVKLSTEMNRTYKERLSIEVEKLRALFDVEVAKMQAYYMSSNIYEDDSNTAFNDVVNDEIQDQTNDEHTPRPGMHRNPRNDEAFAGNNDTRDGNAHHEVPFLQSYFTASPQVSTSINAASPFSLFENIMAYNSLIHHQHIYSQTTAVPNGSNCPQSSGNNSATTLTGA